jgi:hypothetical protein
MTEIKFNEIKKFLINLIINTNTNLRNLQLTSITKNYTKPLPSISPDNIMNDNENTDNPVLVMGYQSLDYIWLLIFDLLIFIFLSIKAYQGAKKIVENIKDTEDPNYANKLKFMKGLVYANGSKNI